MTELKLGKVTSKELAQWFRVTDSYFRKTENKTRLLKVLAKYADYRAIVKGNGVQIIIDFIYEPVYIDERGPSARQRVKQLVEKNWSDTGLDSCLRVAEENYPILKAEGYSIAESTNYRYTCDGRTELWGSPVKRTPGEKGSCHYEWCKKDNDGNLIPFSVEEEQIKNEVTKKYFGSLESWTLGILDDLKKKKITTEEAGNALKDLDAHGEFAAWKAELEFRIGAPIYKGTRLLPPIEIKEGEFLWT